MKKNLFVVPALFVGLMVTASPVQSDVDRKGTVVEAKFLHLDAAETVWVGCLLPPLCTMPTDSEKAVAVTHPDSKTLAGVQKRPPKKWESKG
jgi:hypothetical protein